MVSSFEEGNVWLLAPTCFCLSSARGSPNSGFSHLCTTGSEKRQRRFVLCLPVKAGSSQQHSLGSLSPHQPPAGCRFRQDQDTGSWEDSLKTITLRSQPSHGCRAIRHGSQTLLAGGPWEMTSEVPLKGHLFLPLVQRTFIQFSLLRELWGERILL